MAADALSDLLKTVRLTGATFFDVRGTDPWAVHSPPRDKLLSKVLPGADHLIAYHVVTQGRCYANIVGEAPKLLEAGEIVVFTNCDPHIVSSSPGMRADAPSADVIDIATAGQLPFLVNVGGGGSEATRLVCGYLACDSRPFNPLLENLPRTIKAGNTIRREAGVFGQLVGIALAEAVDKREGGEGVLAKLSELMFIEVLREYLGALPPGQRGWLAGLRDPLVHKALSLIHARPAQGWTIEDLAREAGTSRSVLAARFTELIGTPPMHYLARWRIQIASELLSSGSTTIASVAAEIGYESEAAFSRAFKKAMGIPPSKWRRPQRAGHDQAGPPG